MNHYEQPTYTFNVSNATTVVTSGLGDAVTASATSHVQGTKVELLSSAEITTDIEEFELKLSSGYTAGSAVETLLEVFVDPAGGTAYTTLIPEFCCGKADSAINGGRVFRFRRHVPSGSSLAVATRCSIGSQVTDVLIKAFGRSRRPIRRGMYAEGFGTITNSSGISVTPGTSGSKGAWTDVGTLTVPLWWWELGVSFDDSTLLSQMYWFDLAFGDASNKVMILPDVVLFNNSTRDSIASYSPAPGHFCPVPAGMHLYVRGGTNGGFSDSNCNVRVIGIGG